MRHSRKGPYVSRRQESCPGRRGVGLERGLSSGTWARYRTTAKAAARVDLQRWCWADSEIMLFNDALWISRRLEEAMSTVGS